MDSGNLGKPLMSLYGTEWRERGYGLRLVRVGVHARPLSPYPNSPVPLQEGTTAQDQISGVCFYSGSHRSFIVAFITVLALAHYTGKVHSQPSGVLSASQSRVQVYIALYSDKEYIFTSTKCDLMRQCHEILDFMFTLVKLRRDVAFMNAVFCSESEATLPPFGPIEGQK